VLEWKEHRLDPANAFALRDSLALIQQSFALAQRWYTIDEATRSQSQLTLIERSQSDRRRKRLCRLLLVAVVTILALSCFLPVPFSIQAPASLEPKLQHNVYTPFDGRISQLFVEEGQEVEKDKSLLLLDAPELAQRLQDIKGRLSTLDQERKGLRIAANQATGESNSQVPSLSRLTSQIEELSSQIESLAAQQVIVEKQLAEAEIKSPLAGTVVGWQLKSELLSRPVSRGSLLFRIARFDGPWLLRIRIADRDALHVLRHFETTGMAIRFRLVSDERELYSATITSIAKNIDFDPIDGDFLEAIASIDEKESGRFRFDSSARVLIPCGNAPLGYVLFRSWIDFLQQNFWL
jgi:biotin carboxyl carrier protein